MREKNNDIKANRTDIRKYKTIKKCKTNFIIQIPKKNNKLDPNPNPNNKKTKINNNNNNKIILNNKSLILKNKNIGLNNKNIILSNKSFIINNKNIRINHKKLTLNHKNTNINTNINTNNNNCLDKEKYLNKNYISYYEGYSRNKANKIPKEKSPVSKLKKLYKGANTLNHINYKNKSLNKKEKKYSFLPKMKFSSSTNKIKDPLINKIYVNNYRNISTNNIENRRNNMNFSYLWLTNRDTNYISKSYLNPLNKFVNRSIFQKKIIK